jgi:SLT domain-containing protein
MAAKWLVAAIAQKVFQTETAATATATAATAQTTAASEIWAAYAWMPFGGEALALAEIGVMEASLTAVAAMANKGIVGNAQGSLVTRPTLALIGEGGENEVVAPETVFKDWAGNLANSIAIQQHQALDYRALGASYASQAHQSGAGAAGYVDLRGATIMGSSAESDRLIGNRIQQLMQGRDRRIG